MLYVLHLDCEPFGAHSCLSGGRYATASTTIALLTIDVG